MREVREDANIDPKNVNSLDQDDPINIKPVKMKSTDMKENRNQSLPVKKPTANYFQILIN